MGAVGAYPGTFNPPTVAHLSIAEAAWRQGRLERVDLLLSRQPLGKDAAAASLDARLGVLEAIVATRPWLGVQVTDQRLIADVAAGYDAVIVGADKWLQVVDPAWYGGSAAERDAAIGRLPRVLLVGRPPHDLPPGLPPGSLILSVAAEHGVVSSSGARSGRREWMAAEAVASGLWDW